MYSEGSRVLFADPITTIRTGKPGRPRKIISPSFLRDVFAKHRNISVPLLSSKITGSRWLVNQHRKALGIRRSFSAWTNEELDRFTSDTKEERPALGMKFVQARLRSEGIKVQRERVRQSIKRVDPVGVVLRKKKTIRRRQYKVARPDALWHADGYHKLIKYGIVIHGLVDGFCRTVRSESALS